MEHRGQLNLKQHLQYGKSQARDFGAQISDATISLLAYNLMAYQKARTDYASYTSMFQSIREDTVQPHIMKRYWLEVYAGLQSIAATFSIHIDQLFEQLLSSTSLLKTMAHISQCLSCET